MCKNRLLKLALKLNGRLAKCAKKARRRARRGRPVDEAACVAKAIGRYDGVTTSTKKFSPARCLECTLDARGAVRDRFLALRADIEPLLACDPSVPIAERARCEIKILGAVRRLQADRVKCRMEAAILAFAGDTPDEAGCILTAEDEFDDRTAKLDCPACLGGENAPPTSSTIAPAGVATTTSTTTSTIATTTTTTIGGSTTTTIDDSTTTTTTTIDGSTTTTTTTIDNIQMIQDLVGAETDAIIVLAHCPCRFGGVSKGECPECRTCGASACEIAPSGTVCGDDACVPSACSASGICTVGTPVDCDDGNVCTLDSCVDAGGCSGTRCCRNQRLNCPVEGEGAECVLNHECVPTAGCVYVCEAGCPFVGCQ
jgi:hypothetical protein